MNDKPKLIFWNTKEGKRRLFESQYANHFYALAHLFERQIKPTYCGIASSVMVLNALRLRKKGLTLETKLDVQLPGEGKMAFNCYTQITFFDARKEQGKSRKKVEGKCEEGFDPGFALGDLGRKLRLLLLDVNIIETKTSSDVLIKRFRHDLMAYLNESQTFVIANFDSKTLGREGGGHFSPIVAYHPETDSCLVMDVAGHKNPWFWVPVSLMHAAMNTKDGDGIYRGYLVVSDKLDK